MNKNKQTNSTIINNNNAFKTCAFKTKEKITEIIDQSLYVTAILKTRLI